MSLLIKEIILGVVKLLFMNFLKDLIFLWFSLFLLILFNIIWKCYLFSVYDILL